MPPVAESSEQVSDTPVKDGAETASPEADAAELPVQEGGSDEAQ